MEAPYADVQLLLVQGTSPLSWLIKRFTGSPYSHVGLVIGGLTYEMDTGGFRSIPVAGYPWPSTLHRLEGMTPEKRQIILLKALEFKNRRYDYGKVLGMGLDLALLGLGLRSFRQRLDHRYATECAEMVIYCLEAAGYTFAVKQDEATPGTIAKERFVLP